jgi:hypothetical protein
VIVEVGVVEGTADREIDADGAARHPGIVDIHCHYDGQATWDDRLQPSSWHGVTTVVTGNCGVGFAPVHDADHDRLIQLMEGVEDIPGAALARGPAVELELLRRVPRRRRPAPTTSTSPCPGAPRRGAPPRDGRARRPPRRRHARRHRRHGRTRPPGHRGGRPRVQHEPHPQPQDLHGAYTPTLTAAPDELIGIAEGVGATGTGVLQVVSDFLDPDDEFATLRAMVARSGRPMSISIARNPVVPDAFRGCSTGSRRPTPTV